MSEKEVVDKIIISFLHTIKKIDFFAKINVFNKYFAFAVGFTLTAQIFLYFHIQSQINGIFIQNDNLQNELWNLRDDCYKKTDILLSLLKLNDNLFSDVVLNTNQLNFIRDSLEAIRNKLEQGESEGESEEGEWQKERKKEPLHILDLVEDSTIAPIQIPTNIMSYEFV